MVVSTLNIRDVKNNPGIFFIFYQMWDAERGRKRELRPETLHDWTEQNVCFPLARTSSCFSAQLWSWPGSDLTRSDQREQHLPSKDRLHHLSCPSSQPPRPHCLQQRGKFLFSQFVPRGTLLTLLGRELIVLCLVLVIQIQREYRIVN